MIKKRAWFESSREWTVTVILFVIYLLSFILPTLLYYTHMYSLKYTPVKGLILYNIDGPTNMVNLV